MKQVNNASFKPTLVVGAGILKQVLWYYCNVLFLKSSLLPGSAWKAGLLRLFGAKIGCGVVIKPSVNIKYPWKLTVGDYCWIGEQVWIDNLDQVTLGSSVTLSQGAFLLTGNHNYRKSSFDLITAPINIESGAWIGAKSLVGPGVIVSSHAVLSVESVATKNLEAWGIYRGNPAIKVGERVIED